MEPDISLSLASTLASGTSTQQQQASTQPHQQASNSNTHTTDGQDSSPVPTKRGPGRPKGSTKKTLEADPSSPPKVKRPVGRPRKDGRPAGSVPKVARGPGRPRKNFPPDFAVNTFPQQNQQTQQPNGDQEWHSLQGMFNNYRLPKEATSEPSAPAAGDSSSATDRTNAPPAAPDASNNVSQPSKWYPPTAGASTSNAPAASSSSIANALIHPPSMTQNAGGSRFADPHAPTSSILSLPADRDQNADNINNIQSGMRGLGDTFSPMPPGQIPDFILSIIYSLFSRPSTNSLPLPRDVPSTYRTHLGHLEGSHAMAYNILKTFWLPYSPLLFRLVLPRTTSSSKSAHRNSSASHKPSSLSLNLNFAPHPPQSTVNGIVNGDGQNANRTPPADQNYDSHRFFYWDPFYLSLGGPLSCPGCQNTLVHLGPARTGPLRVFDLPSSSAPTTRAHATAGLVPTTFYVIGMQYGCSQRTCGIKLNSWDARIVNNLPQVLADEWPVHLTAVPPETEQGDGRGTGWSGDAVSRPLYALVKSLLQAGTPQQGVRGILAKLWNLDDSDREEEHEDEERTEEILEVPNSSKSSQDKVAVAEALFASPYQRMWTAQTAQNQEKEASTSMVTMNGQPPAKRQKTNDVTHGLSTAMSTPVTAYMSRGYASQSSAAGDTGPTGLTVQVQPPHEHRTNGSNVDHRSPQIPSHPHPQSQSQSQSQPQVRHHQSSQSQLKPNPVRPQQPSSRTTITHAHAPHIHTPSPIYPSTPLPNSTSNSPQTGNRLKRPLEPETHHPNSAVGPSVPAPAPAPPQTSPAQPHFPGIVHSSPYTHLRPLQQHPQHPSQHPPLPQHHQPPAHAHSRPGPPLHMHHPSLGLAPATLTRFNPSTALQPHQSLLGTAPHPPQTQPPQQPTQAAQSQHAPQRRVRHCVKCGRHDCKGKGGSQFCKNPCKDCGGMDCRGRNSKRPNATCREGW